MSKTGDRTDGEALFRRYVARLEALPEDDPVHVHAEALRDLALEMGLDEGDLARAEEEAERRLRRGRDLAAAYDLAAAGDLEEAGDLDEAIRQLRLAADLSPFQLEPERELARALARRWRRSGSESDRLTAERLLRRAIGVDPGDTEAEALLRVLRSPAPARPRPRLAIAAVALLGIAAVLLLAWATWTLLRG